MGGSDPWNGDDPPMDYEPNYDPWAPAPYGAYNVRHPTEDECSDCVMVMAYDSDQHELHCTGACGGTPDPIPVGPAQVVSSLSRPTNFHRMEYADTPDMAVELMAGNHSVWGIHEEDGSPAYRLGSGCPWHPGDTRWDDHLCVDGPTHERYMYEGGGRHALYVIRTYDSPDAVPDPPITNPCAEILLDSPIFCGCCGNQLSMDDVCRSHTVRGEWCGRCATHVDGSGQFAPWLQTYESLNGIPCPYQV